MILCGGNIPEVRALYVVRHLEEVRSGPRSLSEEVSRSGVLLVAWCGTFRQRGLLLCGKAGLWPARALRAFGDRRFGLFSLVGELAPSRAAPRPVPTMLVLFETSVGYAIFKVGRRVSSWRGKAAVGQEMRGKAVGEDDSVQDRVDAFSVPLL